MWSSALICDAISTILVMSLWSFCDLQKTFACRKWVLNDFCIFALPTSARPFSILAIVLTLNTGDFLFGKKTKPFQLLVCSILQMHHYSAGRADSCSFFLWQFIDLLLQVAASTLDTDVAICSYVNLVNRMGAIQYEELRRGQYSP